MRAHSSLPTDVVESTKSVMDATLSMPHTFKLLRPPITFPACWSMLPRHRVHMNPLQLTSQQMI